jgi:hypothetical protein
MGSDAFLPTAWALARPCRHVQLSLFPFCKFEGTLSGFSGCVYEVREISLMEKRIQASLYYQLRM